LAHNRRSELFPCQPLVRAAGPCYALFSAGYGTGVARRRRRRAPEDSGPVGHCGSEEAVAPKFRPVETSLAGRPQGDGSSQARTVPGGSGYRPPTARLWAGPAANDPMPETDGTGPGVARLFTVPSPSWPEVFRPQDRTVPSVSRTRLWKAPTLTEVTPRRPGTFTGERRSAVEPSPTWPNPFEGGPSYRGGVKRQGEAGLPLPTPIGKASTGWATDR